MLNDKAPHWEASRRCGSRDWAQVGTKGVEADQDDGEASRPKQKRQKPRLRGFCDRSIDGASRARTGDLLGAIQALSQLSYSPAVRRYAARLQSRPVVGSAACRTLVADGWWPMRPGAAVVSSVDRPVMSFRNRLTLFFVVIVVVPMLAVAVILYLLIADSISSQTNASLGASQSAAIGVYQPGQHGRCPGAGGGGPGRAATRCCLGPRQRRSGGGAAAGRDPRRRDGIWPGSRSSPRSGPLVDAGEPRRRGAGLPPDPTVSGPDGRKLEISRQPAGSLARAGESADRRRRRSCGAGRTILAAQRQRPGARAGAARCAGRSGELVQGTRRERRPGPPTAWRRSARRTSTIVR